MKTLAYILMFVILVSSAYAGHMKLLAVSQIGEELVGSQADLSLEVREGSGRVFIETFPITKMDTQISTRFAKEIACSYIEKDCSKYDFFYTIRGESGLIGGPSAGGAIAVLTIAELEGLKMNENISMTGTINSGGIIGPVGGVKQKIEAAKKAGLGKVLIPKGESLNDNETNSSNASIEEYGKENGIEIIEVTTVDEAVYQFTGYKKDEENLSLQIDKEYSDTMKELASMLCDKTIKLQSQLMEDGFLQGLNETLKDVEESGINLTIKGKEAFDKEMYYSSASYCFGANLKYRYLLLKKENLTKEELVNTMNDLQKEMDNFEKEIESKEKKTITDLETYMVVKERITEAKDRFNGITDDIINGRDIEDGLAYVTERLYSAGTWAKFFGKKGKEYDLSNETMKKSCQDKLAEAEERYQYLRFFIPDLLLGIRKDIDFAYKDYETGEYYLCLFDASKAKAEADTIVGSMGVEDKDLSDLIDKKIEIVGKNLAKQANKGIFPILGYSYYEYAKSLKEDDKYSAMLYLEYALELGNLDIYFEKEQKNNWTDKLNFINKEKLIIFAAGAVIGLVFGLLIRAKARKQTTPRKNHPKTASSRGKRGDR